MKTTNAISQFDTYRHQTQPNHQQQKTRQVQNNTIKGVLLNNHIKKDSQDTFDDFDKISTALLIPENLTPANLEKSPKKESFDYKKTLAPIAITSAIALGALGLTSLFTHKYSKILATKNDVVRPGDLARNINILEEPHFAMYRLLRDPNAKNIAGFIGVGIMSAATLIAKNFVDGTKEIWVKKQNYDIEYDLQESLIDVEAEAFSGKLNVANTLLSDTTKYFKSVLSDTNNKEQNFKSFLSFSGNKEQKEDKKDNSKLKTALALGASIIGFVGISYALFKNYQKTLKNLDTFVQKFEHNEIESKIQNAINLDDKNSALKELIALFKVINAKDETMQINFSKIKGITPQEINKAINEVKSAQIYAQAPEALGGISEKIQYYCYINEERGHLYNWILNPDNKFNKYLFLCFSAISATGYLGRQVAQAVKETVVSKENSKNELALKKRLVEVQIENFKAKKLSAINPMIENFNRQLEQGKSKEELKQLAENILIEIKNGPPYVYD